MPNLQETSKYSRCEHLMRTLVFKHYTGAPLNYSEVAALAREVMETCYKICVDSSAETLVDSESASKSTGSTT